ncbi:MAG: hypothetical protein V3W41_00600 [Planctomycetota bacterium]
MSSFDHFDEQVRSWEHLEDRGPQLVEQAIEIQRLEPDAILAGLIIEAGTPEFEALSNRVDLSGESLDQQPGFLGVVPLSVAISMLDDDGRTWLRENCPVGTEHLPVVAILKNGLRLACLPLSPSS